MHCIHVQYTAVLNMFAIFTSLPYMDLSIYVQMHTHFKWIHMYVCLYIFIYLLVYVHVDTYVHNMLIRMYISVQLLQEFIAVWRWTIYQRWGVYSVDDATDSSGKVSRPSASQHSIMTKVHIRMYIC